MSQPPPDPQNPYGSGPYGAGPYGPQQPPGQQPPPQQQLPPQMPYGAQPPPPPPYGYAPTGGYGMPPHPGQPGYPGYPGQHGYPGYPAHPGYPGGMPWLPMRMPNQLATARVLLFVAGSLWALLAVLSLIAGFAAEDATDDLLLSSESGDTALVLGIFFFLLGGGLSALHITAGSLFARGGQGTRAMGIVAGAVNTVAASWAMVQYETNSTEQDSPVLPTLWLATAVLTVVLCSVRQAGEWFNRPRPH